MIQGFDPRTGEPVGEPVAETTDAGLDAIVASAVSFLSGMSGGPPASAESDATIPATMLALYQEAAATCPGLPWTVLAAIGTVESDNGQSNLPGVHGGANAAGAEGPMHFLSATFAEYAVNADPGQPASPYNQADAIYAAAALLCASGARGGTPDGIEQAVFAYNHAGWYVAQVMSWAGRYAARTLRDGRDFDIAGCHQGPLDKSRWSRALHRPPCGNGQASGVGLPCRRPSSISRDVSGRSAETGPSRSSGHVPRSPHLLMRWRLKFRVRRGESK